jgi:hypothetical protein
MSRKLKPKCCESFKEGKKFCEDCPRKARLGKGERKTLLAKYRAKKSS